MTVIKKFVAADGVEFSTAAACKVYESNLGFNALRKMEDSRVYLNSFSSVSTGYMFNIVSMRNKVVFEKLVDYLKSLNPEASVFLNGNNWQNLDDNIFPETFVVVRGVDIDVNIIDFIPIAKFAAALESDSNRLVEIARSVVW